jgi:hypothetical protein
VVQAEQEQPAILPRPVPFGTHLPYPAVGRPHLGPADQDDPGRDDQPGDQDDAPRVGGEVGLPGAEGEVRGDRPGAARDQERDR